MNELSFGRLLYLTRELQVKLPPTITNKIPGGPWLSSLRSLVDPLTPDQSQSQAVRLYAQGSTLGPPTMDELLHLVTSILDSQGDISGAEWLEIAKALSGMKAGILGLSETIESFVDLSPETFVSFPTGFIPLDSVLGGGVSPGIILFIGAPGSGKSSIMMMIAEALSQTLADDQPIIYVQTEMPSAVFKTRFAPIKARSTFRPQDTLICAPWGTGAIMDYLEGVNNPRSVVIYDSPDPLLLAGTGDAVRFSIAQAWLDLIRIKQSMASTILVTSWSRRGEAGNLSLESGAEGAAKERYSDAVLGINPEADGRVRLSCYKNRMGAPDGSFSFRPNWGSLTLEL